MKWFFIFALGYLHAEIDKVTLSREAGFVNITWVDDEKRIVHEIIVDFIIEIPHIGIYFIKINENLCL